MTRAPLRTVVPVAACFAAGIFPVFAEEQAVQLAAVDDRKAVIATVEPVHEFPARARIGGTITALTVKEGDFVKEGDRIAMTVDEKLRLQMQALQSRIQAQQADREHHREGQEVEQRTDRAENQHEPADEGDVPM